MKVQEMYNILKEFAEYLDKMESGKDKGILSKIFIGYNETLKAYNLAQARYAYHFENNR